MNTPKIADYTTRKSYQQEYARDNREAINARKRAWRAARKKKTLKLSGNMVVIQLDANGEAGFDGPEELLEGYTEGFEE